MYSDPELARATHTQDASYLDVIHTSEGEWNPSDYAYHLTRRARGLPLWFSLAVYGLEAYRQAIEVAASLAIQTAELIKAALQLELIREPDLGSGAVPPARLETRGVRGMGPASTRGPGRVHPTYQMGG